jgi:hypothetical protein
VTAPAPDPEPSIRPNPTVKELRDKIAKGMPSEELAIMLAKERAGANRPTAVTVIEAALRKAQAPP